MKKKVTYWQEPRTIEVLVESLKNENMVLGTSDTVLGLLAGVSDNGKRALDLLKIRENKPYIVLTDSIEKLKIFTDQKIDSKLAKLISFCWPGPLTLIFKEKQDLFYLKHQNVAIRIPKHEGLLKLLKFFPGLFSTSANISGEPMPKNIDEVDDKILNSVDLIVIDEQKVNNILPSTILDCTGKQIRVVREGAYDIQELEKIYGETFVR